MPGWLKPLFELCISQFTPKTKEDSRFLTNYNIKSKQRSQNYGMNKVKALAKDTATNYRIEGKHTNYLFRPNGATNLAELGMSIVAL